jgi:homoserine O-acetyltransferase/O-succinyltransferase
VHTVLQAIQCPMLVLGMDSDILYPLSEQEEIAQSVPQGKLEIIRTINGHDGFLLEQQQVASYVLEFLSRHT